MHIDHDQSFNKEKTASCSRSLLYIRSILSFLFICSVLSSTFISPAASISVSASSSLAPEYLLDPAGAGSPVIDGKAYILYDAQSGTFLLGKNQDTPLSPASITKVMTILLAFEKLKLSDEIIVTRDMIKGIPSDYMLIGLIEGEVITVEQALYACLLISANDAAKALAVKIGGSEKRFAEMMNMKAVELGCTNTNFTNSYGFSDKAHLTTAHDMALIMAEALKYEAYTKISTAKNYTMPATNKFDKTRLLINSNRFISAKKYDFDTYIGGKTGFTNMSGFTITAGVRQNGRTLISVILGASVSEIRYSNLVSLFNYGFTAYSTESIYPSEFKDIQSQTIEKVSSAIEKSGNRLLISNTALKLDEYITTTSTRKSGGYSVSIDMGQDIDQTIAQAGFSDQVLKFPLYRKYSDGIQNQVGTLEMTIELKASDSPGIAGISVMTIIFRIFISLLLAVIMLICAVSLYIFIRRYLKRLRRHRRKRNH